MKHFAYTLLGIALLMSASCAKMEENAVPEQPDSFRIKATIDNSEATKTSYTENEDKAVISWSSGDEIRLIAYNSESKEANHYTCYVINETIEGDVADFNFPGTIKSDYPLSDYAVYPGLGRGGVLGAFTLTLPAEYSISGSDLTQVKVPLIGVKDSNDDHSYVFSTAVGVLKLTLSNVPVSARKVVLFSASDNLSGTFPLDAVNGLQMDACATGTGGHSITVNISQQTAGSTISVYMPVPVGYISAGAYFEVQTIDGTAIKTTEVTKKDIPVVKGHLLPLPAISVEDWVDLGTGKYMDDHGFYYLGIYGRSADDYANVTIQKHASEFGRYRIYRPYDSCPYVETDLPNAADYLYIDIKDATNGIVANHSYKYNNDANIMFDGCWWGYSALYHNSRIIKYDGSGDPANIQLAPYYYDDFYYANFAQNPKIEIVFPGSTPMMAGVFGYTDGASASYSDGVVTVGISNSTITGVKVKAAATIDAGVAALQAGEQDLTFTTTGSLDLNLPLGTYYLIYKVETDGHGYVYKNAGQFTAATEILLNASMLSVNVDAGDKDGNLYDGGGKDALVDGDTSTYWHTPYYSAADIAYYKDYGYFSNITGTPYDYTDLDDVYGAYINIDLGPSKTVTTFQVRACLRNASSNFPKHVVVYTSADNSTWTQVAEVENICAGIAAGSWINPITCNSTAARYVRFSIIGNTSNKDLRVPSDAGCTHLAEIKLFE